MSLQIETQPFQFNNTVSVLSSISAISLYGTHYGDGSNLTGIYSGLTENWQSSFTTLTANSANWDSTYTTLCANSGAWNNSYTTLTDNSANWNNNYTTLTANSANWDSTYTTLTANSANWNNNYTTLTANSAKWNSAYTTLCANSGTWNTSITAVNGTTNQITVTNPNPNAVTLSIPATFCVSNAIRTLTVNATVVLSGATVCSNNSVFAGGNISAGTTITAGTCFIANSGIISRGPAGSYQSFAAGDNALAAQTTGSQNVAIGANALASGTIISQNVAIGANALQNTVTPLNGGRSVAIGYNAMQSGVMTGCANVAIGYQALCKITSGMGNTASGYNTLASNDAGSNNVAIGNSSLVANTSGNNNVGIGPNALGSNTTGSNNVAVGVNNLATNTTGNNGVGIGTSNFQKSFGPGNIGIGTNSGYNTTTGSNNVVLSPYQTMQNNVSGSDNFAVGYRTLFNANSGCCNAAIIKGALYNNCGGCYNVAIGYNSGYCLNTGNNNIFIGTNSGYALATNSSNNTIIGNPSIPASSTCNNTVIVAAGNTERFRVDQNGCFGIGTTTPNQNLTVVGTISASTAVYANGVQLGSGSGNVDLGQIPVLSANWNNSYTTLTANSANWNNAYTLATGLTSISSSWVTYSNLNTGSFVKYTDINSVSANWNNAYTWVNGNSANAQHTTLTLTNTALTASINQPLLSIYGAASASSFLQIQNTANTLSASTDVSIYNNLGNYLDLGINSSSYNGNAYYGGSFTITGSGDGYLYNTTNNLILGTTSTVANNSNVIIFAGGSLSGTAVQGGNEVARFLSGGNVGIGTSTPNRQLTVVGDISATGNVYSVAGTLGTGGGGGGSTAGALLSTTTGTFAATGANVIFSTVSAANLSAAAFYGSGSEMVLSDGIGSNDTGNGVNTLSLNFTNGTYVGSGGLSVTNLTATNVVINGVAKGNYLASTGSAIGPTLTNYGISTFTLAPNGVYELFYDVYYLKTTAGSVAYYLSGTNTFSNVVGEVVQTAVGGGATSPVAYAAPTKAYLFGATAATIPFAATGSLTTAVYHNGAIRYMIINSANTNTVQLAISANAGTVTPQQGSYGKLIRVA